MRRAVPRLAALCILGLSLLQCGPDSIGVVVHVQNVTSNVSSLHVNAMLDGKSAFQEAEFTQQFRQFTVKLPATTIGSGYLAINAVGLDSDRCKLSTGHAETQLSQDAPVTGLDLSLTLLPAKLCTDFSRKDFAAGINPFSIAVGDFNKDQKLDLVVTDPPTNQVNVLLGNGMGGFGTAINLAVGRYPRAVAVGDFDADQNIDLAVTNGNDDDVSVLLGDGMGGFGPATNFATGVGPFAVAVGDFNGDHRVDLATTSYGPGANTVSILLGDGTGRFGAKSDVPVGMNPTSIVVGDLNSDGNPDLAAANALSGNVSILLGNGKGGFPSVTNFGASANANSIAIGDLNGDQKLDLAVTNSMGNNVGVFYGNGLGSFGGAYNLHIIGDTVSVVVGDFNGDRKSDVAVANFHGNDVSVLLGNGQGGFGAVMNFATDTLPVALATGDFNGDNKLDLVVANNTGSITVLINISL